MVEVQLGLLAGRESGSPAVPLAAALVRLLKLSIFQRHHAQKKVFAGPGELGGAEMGRAVEIGADRLKSPEIARERPRFARVGREGFARSQQPGRSWPGGRVFFGVRPLD
jgi:hypothetical protein